MNQVMMVGRVVRPIEVTNTSNGSFVSNNVLAVKSSFRTKKGDTITDFIPFVTWNNVAKNMEKYCTKGQLIAISGRMQSRNYVNKDNQTVYVVECLANEVMFLQTNTSQLKKDPIEKLTEEFSVEDSEQFQEIIESLKKEEK